MKMHIASLVFLSLLNPLAAPAENCLPFQGKPVALQGSVVLRTFHGPPSYGEQTKTDRQESQVVLKLRRTICVVANREDGAAAETGQSEITLVAVRDLDLRAFVGKEVDVEGTLFPAMSGHHHTPVLIQVERIQLPLDVYVRQDGTIEADGQVFREAEGFRKFLLTRRPATAQIHPERTTPYEAVRSAMDAIQRAGGIDMGLVGNEQTK